MRTRATRRTAALREMRRSAALLREAQWSVRDYAEAKVSRCRGVGVRARRGRAAQSLLQTAGCAAAADGEVCRCCGRRGVPLLRTARRAAAARTSHNGALECAEKRCRGVGRRSEGERERRVRRRWAAARRRCAAAPAEG
ncbi:hypothetical protein FA09DRAFT_270573 [Tilletiopsis washingtonensis]|uniref:Uncharacterized protein n=1 Tax=Tilletiopsis washingtonensis TaxID=58919 RepID=A0A316ZC33_9BASI|nr:hypothetical protein FA09DRAFT_270573 [Tilletiopsis washingtonensis]PWN98598.1 hypothetical protein FA09DRAFT_270573 [Tilletiopsis washingtonensis]